MRFKVASRVRGLSDEAFREAFGTEEQCRAALLRLRWPDGFLCPCCGHRGHCVLAGRGLYQCNRCKKQTSPTAGTIFHATKLPLTLWFAAIHLIVTAKNGISSVELGRRLGVKQPTAWAVKHKIMAVMARREGETALTGRVEMDDAYLGGVRSGGKRGRGAAGKTPFVAAVSTSPEGRPGKLKLAPVKGFRKREIARGAKHWLAPGAAVVTDGLGCWSALDEIACSHQAIRTGSGRQAARMASFKWVNTTLGNIKSAITGTYRKLGPDHAGRYLASFAWRYNRRYQLETMIPRFVHRRRTHRAHALSPPHCRMTFRDKQVRLRYGVELAFDYVVGEKLLNFAEAAAEHPEFAQALPQFVSRVRGMFTPEEIKAHLARTERRRREMEEVAADDEDPGFADDKATAERARQFDLVKELLTAPALGTS